MSEELMAAAGPAPEDAMLPPVRGGSPRGETWRRLWRKPRFLVSCGVVILLILISVFPAFFAGFFGNGDPTYCDLSKSVDPPTSGHPFGFDIQGCDVYANVIYGARASLSVGFIATFAALLVAVIIGSLAGLYGGLADSVISRTTDIFLGFPFLLGAIVVLTSLHSHSVVVVGLVLALFGWPTLARLMRAQVRSVRDAEYVVAARGLGSGTGRILRKHILPNTLAPVLAIASVSVGGVLVAEASLTFLGIGLRPPTISWGLQLAAAQTQFGAHPHLLIFPGLFLSITVLALITTGDAIRDAFDPRAS